MHNTRLSSSTTQRAIKITNSLSEIYQYSAFQPSLGLYHVQDHMRRSMSELVSRGEEFNDKNQELKGVVFDCQYTVDEMKRISLASNTLSNVNILLIQAIDRKRQLDEARILSRPPVPQSGATSINS
ncbi:Protein MEF2BNB isoform X3 [Oopsacas minuta]|uniref:Protein MEF2BNB isoform X3 n=1 Tax=Oopsacas minuta TaxID=111878 RepID=A0AAV7JS57_9METZ|nr:Protein MEF2BNB isoform X3 [Oopsacas minuta]